MKISNSLKLLVISMLIMSVLMSCKKDFSPETLKSNDLSPAKKEWVTAMIHPGILHNRADLDRIKKYANSSVYPPMESYLALKGQSTASASYQMKGPFINIARDGVDKATKNAFEQDFNAAYHNALMWVITGDELHAKKAVEILNAYSNTLKGITGSNDNTLTASFGGFILVNAAEIMRYTYPAWTGAEITQCETMFRNVFVKEMNLFYARPAYTNGNWGISVVKAMMGIGVFLNDKDIFNKAVDFFYSKGIDNGSLANYIINPEGQCQESGRDQGHVLLGLGSTAEACEVGYKQNLDMYGALGNRLLAGFEYSAKYNLGNSVPYVKWTDVTGKYSSWEVISDIDRGKLRPVFEIAYNAYVRRKKLLMPWTEKVIEKNGPEGMAVSCDNPGFGTLLFYTGEVTEKKNSAK